MQNLVKTLRIFHKMICKSKNDFACNRSFSLLWSNIFANWFWFTNLNPVYFSFWAIFCQFTPLTAQKNQNFKKMKKTLGDIIILHMCTRNYKMIYGSWDMVCDRWMNRQTDRWTDGQKKWHIEVGANQKIRYFERGLSKSL